MTTWSLLRASSSMTIATGNARHVQRGKESRRHAGLAARRASRQIPGASRALHPRQPTRTLRRWPVAHGTRRSLLRRWRSSEPPPCGDRALTTRRDAVIYRGRSSESGANSRAFRSNKKSPADAGTDPNREFSEEKWRRRPDLNRGWRFCRPYGVPIRSAWLRLLVPDDAWVSLLFGRCCSEVAPTFRPETVNI